MPGNILWKEQGIVTLTTALGALIQNGGGIANATANLDCRTAGNAADMFTAGFELSVLQWSTITGIVAGTIVGDLYLVPSLDGTNVATVNIANAATDYISSNFRVGSFICPLTAVASTSYRFAILNVDLQPFLYTPYIINRSGQTFTANAVLKVVAAEDQYT